MRDRVAVALFVAFAIAVAGCNATSPSGSSADAPEATGAPVVDTACAIEQEPGPGDAPTTGGEMDTSNDGPGRWRLCIDTPSPVSVEGTAWCTWNAARTSVDAVSGLPTNADGVDYDAVIDFPGSGFEIHATDGGGAIANYGPRFDLPSVETDSAHREGSTEFEASLQLGEDVAPVDAPDVLEGRLRWVCGEPPAAA